MTQLNTVVANGLYTHAPEHSHTAGDTDFYKFELVTKDGRITAMISDNLMQYFNHLMEIGTLLFVEGELSSFCDAKSRKTERYVFVRYLAKASADQQTNDIRLTGIISKIRKEADRTTVTVVYKKGSKTTLSVICDLSEVSEEVIESLKIGQEVLILGQYRTREYESISENGREIKTYQDILVKILSC